MENQHLHSPHTSTSDRGTLPHSELPSLYVNISGLRKHFATFLVGLGLDTLPLVSRGRIVYITSRGESQCSHYN